MDLNLREVGEDVVVVAPDGVLDSEAATQFNQAIEAYVADGRLRIIIEGARLAMLSSSGIAAMLMLHHRVAEDGGSVHLAAINATVRDIIRIARLEQVLTVHDSVEAALAALDNDPAN